MDSHFSCIVLVDRIIEVFGFVIVDFSIVRSMFGQISWRLSNGFAFSFLDQDSDVIDALRRALYGNV